MEKEYIYLVGLIIAVVLFDLLLKKRKKKLNEDVVVYNQKRSKSDKFKYYAKYLLSFTIIIFIAYGIFLVFPKFQSQEVEINIIPSCIDTTKNLKNCNKFYFEIKNQYVSSVPGKLNNLKYVDINGKIKTFNSELVVNQSFINDNMNNGKFEVSFTFFENNPFALFLYENFNEGFWTKKITFSYQFSPYSKLPKIDYATISYNGKQKKAISLIQSSYDDEVSFNYNPGPTFEVSNYIYPITNTGGYVTLEIKLSGIDYDEIDEYYYLIRSSYVKGKHYDFDTKGLNGELSKKTTVTKTSDGVILKRDYNYEDVEGYEFESDFNLVISKRKKFHIKKLVSFSSDLRGPNIFLSEDSFNSNTSNEKIFIDEKEWRGNRHPYEITIEGYVNKLLINGQNIQIDRNKKYQKIFREVYFSVPLGYYRIPIVAYDRYGNRNETYLEGPAIRGD